MLISAKIIKNPRKKWRCDGCTKVIEGELLRIYGSAHSGEMPLVARIHPDCVSEVWRKTEPKLVMALEAI